MLNIYAIDIETESEVDQSDVTGTEKVNTSIDRVEIARAFSRFDQAVLQPLASMARLSMNLYVDQMPYNVFAPTAPALCQAMKGAGETRAMCRRSHAALRDQARKSRTAETALCCGGYHLFIIPLCAESECYGFIEGGRVMGAPLDPIKVERLFRILRRTRATTNWRSLREDLQASPLLPEQELTVLIQLVRSVAQNLLAEIISMARPGQNPDHPAISKAKLYIRSHLTEALTVSTVARVAGLSEDYFGKLFKGSTGMGLPQYLAEHRIIQASDLLRTTRKHISEIAYECGFQSGSHFNRAFKRHIGTTPGDFRKSRMDIRSPT
ncbi:MAG TPA: helix-turn-helix domain-containing protein [Candidatus Methylacidiphilales bacterium]